MNTTMSKRNEARVARQQRTTKAREIVAEVARLRRIQATENERDALMAVQDSAGFKEMLYSERGCELRAFNNNELPPIKLAPRHPAAPRNSGTQEAILDTLADGKMATTGAILERLGMIEPTPAQRVTVSRALARLRAKDLIEAYEMEGRTLRGNGSLWQVKTDGLACGASSAWETFRLLAKGSKSVRSP